MKEVPCRVCSKPVLVRPDASSGVCSDCVFAGKFTPETPKPTPEATPPTASPAPAKVETAPAPQAPKRVEVVPVVPKPAEKPEKKLPKERKPKKEKPKENMTAIVNGLLRQGKERDAIISAVKEKFSSSTREDIMNLICVQRHRLNVAKKKEGKTK